MYCAASHAFHVSIGVVGTIAANPLKNDGCAMTHSGALSMPCGLAHAIQSKPGKSATIFVTAILLYVLTASRLSTCVHWILASSVSSANTAFASSAALGPAGQREDLLEVGLVLRAHIRERRVVFQVVVAIGQRRAALAEVQRDLRRIAGVSLDEAADGTGQAEHRQLARNVRHLGGRRDRVDLGEVRLERRRSCGVDVRFVDEARVEVADLLRGAAGLLVLVAAELLDERVEIGLGLVRELHERAVDRAIGRQRGLREPRAVHVAEQIVLRPDGLVEVGRIDAGLERRILRVWQRGQQDDEGGEKGEACSHPDMMPLPEANRQCLNSSNARDLI